MRSLTLTTLALALPAAAMAAPVAYQLDPNHTSVMWRAKHMGYSTVTGKFTAISGTFVLDEKNPAASKVEAVLDMNAITTGLPKFEEHLKSKDFFNVAENPAATFVSTKVEPIGTNNARMTGNLTILGITKPIVLDVTLNKSAVNEMFKKQVAGFSAKGVVKRSDYGITYAIPAVPDEIPLEIEVEGSPL